MTEDIIKESPNKTYPRTDAVHRILAHSYSVYFLLFLIGITLDLVFRFEIFKTSIMEPLGIAILLLGSFLIFWAQKTSRNFDSKNLTKDSFCKGPYCYSRSPTHWGLFLLMLGFAVTANTLFVILSTLVSFFISKFVFLQKQENILAQKYGAPYLEYKKSVKL